MKFDFLSTLFFWKTAYRWDFSQTIVEFGFYAVFLAWHTQQETDFSSQQLLSQPNWNTWDGMQFYLPLKINLLHPKQAINSFCWEKTRNFLFINCFYLWFWKKRKGRKQNGMRKSHLVVFIYWFTTEDRLDHKNKLVSCPCHGEFERFFLLLCFQCKNLHQKYSANEISNFLVRCAPFNRLLIVFHWICPLAVHSVSISINNIYRVAATSIKNGLSVIVVIVAIVICAIWKISN